MGRLRAVLAGRRYPVALTAVLAVGVVGSAVLGRQVGSIGAERPDTATTTKRLTVTNPYAVEGGWYRGNLHVASLRGTGKDLPSAIGRWYAGHGYAFLGISDMNTYTWGSEYGSRGMPAVPVVTATYSYADLLAVGIDHWRPALDLQGAIRWIAAAGGLPVLASPLSASKPNAAAAALRATGLFGLEVYDARLAASNAELGDATPLWDRLLTAGQRVYAFAGDGVLSLEDPALGHAWITVLAPANDPDALLSSLRRGAFVASTGAAFIDFRVDGVTITVRADAGTSLRFIGRGGRLLQSVGAGLGSYRVRGDEGYVRVEAVRDDGGRAWSQPFFLDWR
jgi:hypothetical protein